ncbi:MAG: GntR family transcriptional regulator [Clostridia bacterium]|nr:GntR family transcriptional regulator [Lachnospiraceae bacterium]NCB99989.1 GntR family transcriptional regulator [Clostridia bacterium]NCD03532.1 GntR family transcriptional regulator [Clostridia bacterium]
MLKNDFSEEQGKYSLTEKVYQALRSDILSGGFKDQEELKENALAKDYGVSRTPVREAIRQLALEGLVDTIPNRGAYVHNIHCKDVVDVYAMRSLLEGLAARWAVENATKEQIEAMEEVVYMSEYYRNKGNLEQVYVSDNRFHELLYIASGSHLLEHMLRMFHEYVQQVRKNALKDEIRAKNSFEEHAAILEAIKNHQADEAARLATQHIENAVESWKVTDAIHAVE